MTDSQSPNPDADDIPAGETEEYAPTDGTDSSDVVPADSATADAPSFRAPVAQGAARPPVPPFRRDPRPPALLPGAEIDDFEIIRLLGRGAFGHVYLARQRSLDREVALKVSANRGSEGRTMARLEHAHIVQVFSENVDAATDQRLLCMQLVPGVALDKLIAALEPPWTGADLLAAIDRNAALPAALDPTALRDREALREMDAVEATAWLGARLAEALDFAHHHGVLHRDIKPANILVSPYGRPLLADFNISAKSVAEEGEEEAMFGGTIAYMAPEHLDAFNPTDSTPHDAVTAQTDIYSLGLVLHELLSGPTRELPDRSGGLAQLLRKLADQRRNQPRSCNEGVPSAGKTLERTICRCLAPQPADRFASGAELAEQLDGCRQQRLAERRLPRPTWLVERIVRRPFLWFIGLVILPQLVGSAINISYNLTQLVGQLSAAQQAMFWNLVNAYNAVVYPLATVVFSYVVWRAARSWRAFHGTTPLAAGETAAARSRVLRLPLWVAGLTVLGWLPGGLLFPAAIHLSTEPVDLHAWLHFFASFTLSGLIALAYSLCGSQFVVQRALYPRMWDDVRHFTATTRQELAPMATRLSWIQALAGSIPLLAAVLLLVLGGDADGLAFRGIVAALIVLGWAGYQLAMHVTRGLTETIAALTGAKA